MNKRGISTVVATVLIILITIAAVAIIWAAIIPLIQTSLNVVNYDGHVSIATTDGYTAYDSVNEILYVQVEQDGGEQLTDIKIIVEKEGSLIYENEFSAPGVNIKKVYPITLTGLGVPDSVKVAPIFSDGTSKIEGNVASELNNIPQGVVSGGPGGSSSIGDTSNNPGTSCLNIHQLRPTAANGLYWVKPSGTPSFQVYCDMSTDGGGWMLILSYNKPALQNPNLNPTAWPLNPSSSLSHVDNIQQFGFGSPSAVRLYCDTTLHPRIIHFKTINANVISSIYDNSIIPTSDNFKIGFIALAGHSAGLPGNANSYTGDNSNQLFSRDFPFFLGAVSHWAIKGFGGRWECDDWADNANYATNHQVWVK